jgi:hypothetical protein
MTQRFDLIGDVHGQYDKLVALLEHLGYEILIDTWWHPDRTAIFVGDLIDRGPKQVETIDLVEKMVSASKGRCILGNHEFNAIAWMTPDPDRPGEYLRPHGKPGNRGQHQAFLDEVEGTPRHAQIIDWFRSLPMWLDFGDLRVVHACWHQPSIDKLQAAAGHHQRLSDELILFGSRKGHPLYQSIETVFKGPELTLPPGIAYQSDDGKERHEVRIAWWQENLSTYRQAAHVSQKFKASVPLTPIDEPWHSFAYRGPPVIFGHYWFNQIPDVISDKLACIDYSAGGDGPLVAYRWDGEKELSGDKLAWVDGQ